jgi:hypothetical protein
MRLELTSRSARDFIMRTAKDPHATAVEFAREVLRHACAICGWDPSLAASVHGNPPTIRRG